MAESVRGTPSRPRVLRRIRHRVLRRPPLPGWWPLALCVLLGVGAGSAYGLLKEPEYAATGYVAVVPEGRADPAMAVGFAQAYGRIATSAAVLAAARAEPGVPPGALAGRVQAVTSPDAPLIEVTGTGTRAGEAAAVANAVARALTRTANTSATDTDVRLAVFAAAAPPSAPSSVSPALAAAVGGCAGGLVGGLLLLVRPSRRGTAAVPGVAVPGEAVPGVAAPDPEPAPVPEPAPASARPRTPAARTTPATRKSVAGKR